VVSLSSPWWKWRRHSTGAASHLAASLLPQIRAGILGRRAWRSGRIAGLGAAPPLPPRAARLPSRGLVGLAVLLGVLLGARRLAAFDADAIDAAARALPRLHSLLVSQRGQLIYERYYNRATATRLANVKSASKSVIAALVGIAIERGSIEDVRTPLTAYFPELAKDPDARKRTITVEDLLEMRSGLEGTSGRDYGAWVTSGNWVRHALSRPMLADPGEDMDYSTGNTHLLSAILTKATGVSTWRFANDALAKPLGFTLAQWPRDPQGIFFGGNEMLMTPRQLLAIGELYRNHGRAGGRQIVPEAWVARSCRGRARELPSWARGLGPGGVPDPMRDRKYGYGWWVHDLAGHQTCFAWGYGGQYAFVVPDLDLVIVSTASPDVGEERRGHRRQLFDILSDQIVRPLSTARATAGRVQ
jgi:CubicO group peptidase (beta-lactamase class C family)